MKHATGSYWRILVVAVGLGLLGLCACMAEDVVETEVKIWVGPDGGSVLGPRGTRLIIPQGAVSDLVQISMIQVNEQIVPDLSGAERLSIAMVARPDDFAFDKPVTVLLPYDPTGLSASDQKATLSIYRAPEWSDAWEDLGGTVNVDTNELRTQTRRLGVFAIFSSESDATDGDADGDMDADEAGLNCSCEDWQGTYCRDTLEGCTDLRTITIAQSTADSCRHEFALIDDDGNALPGFALSHCAVNTSPTFTSATQGECRLFFNTENQYLYLACSDCEDRYTLEACAGW